MELHLRVAATVLVVRQCSQSDGSNRASDRNIAGRIARRHDLRLTERWQEVDLGLRLSVSFMHDSPPLSSDNYLAHGAPRLSCPPERRSHA